MTVLYRTAETGGWLAFASERLVLLVGGMPSDQTVADIWDRLAQPDPAQGLLELLTGRGLAATPPFVLLEPADAGTRVIVRGDASVTNAGDVISGAGVATWSERIVSDGDSSVAITGATATRGELPLRSGVVIAAALRITTADGSAENGVEGADIDADIDIDADVDDEVSTDTVVMPDRRRATKPSPAESDVRPSPPAAPPIDPLAAAAQPPTARGSAFESAATDESGSDIEETIVPTDVHPELEDATDETVVRGGRATPLEIDPEIDGSAGDHDGRTMLSSDVGRLRGARQREKTDAAPVAPAAEAIPVVVMPNGTRETLSQPLLVGRAPSASNVPGGLIPRLVPIGGGDQDISRTHLRLALEGGTVVVTDLHSRNGTTVALPGRDPQRLRAGEPTPVIAGSVVDLGGGIVLRVEAGR